MQISQVLFTLACHLAKNGDMEVTGRRARTRPKTWPMGQRRTHRDKPFIPLNPNYQTTFPLLPSSVTFTIFLLGKYQP